jgi:exonuclease III
MEIFRELERLKIDIAALTETKRKGTGIEEDKNYIQIYSGVSKYQRATGGVSILINKKYKKCINEWQYIDERIVKVQMRLNGHDVTIVGVYAPNDDADDKQKDNFYNKLCSITDNKSSRKELIILGDLNARTGSKRNDSVVGPHGELMTNENGSRLIEYCEQYGLRIMNGFFQHRKIHRYTWTQTTRQLKSIIDYINIKQNTHVKPQDVRVYRGAECGSDHYLVIMKIYLPYRKRRNGGELEIEKKTTLDGTRYKVRSLQQEPIRFL